MLIVVLFAFGGQLIGPLVQRFRGQSEWAEYIARVVDFAAVMSNDDSTSTPADDEATRAQSDSVAAKGRARRPGVSDASSLPKDLPLHPHALEADYNVSPTHVLVYQRVAGPREAAIAELRSRMNQQGWKVASENPGDWSTIIRWTKGDRSCLVEFDDDSSGTEIWIRSVAPGSRQSVRSRQ